MIIYFSSPLTYTDLNDTIPLPEQKPCKSDSLFSPAKRKTEVFMEKISENNILDVSSECDVCVCGGGVAGIAAALSAKRAGAEVLLLEKSFLPGGLATSGLVTIFLPLCDGLGNQVSFGLAEELIKLSVKYGAEIDLPEAWKKDCPASVRAQSGRYQARFNAQLFAIASERLLLDEGVKILYGTSACGVSCREGKISHVIIENKSGRSAVKVRKSVVDATGDADICRFSGETIRNHSKGNLLAAWYYYISGGKYMLNMLGFADVTDEKKTKEFSDNLLENGRYYQGADASVLSEFVCNSRAKILSDILSRRQKGAEDLLPVTIPTVPQVRMTACLVGKTVLGDDRPFENFSDSIGIVSDWRKKGPCFSIPFSCLYGNNVKNLITAGRCISVNDRMWDITRVIPDCAVTGQAAGLAAAISSDFDLLDVTYLQSSLKENGVKLFF